jgi:hypothetical protein
MQLMLLARHLESVRYEFTVRRVVLQPAINELN